MTAELQTVPCRCVEVFSEPDPDCLECDATGAVPLCACGNPMNWSVERADGMCSSCWYEQRRKVIDG